MYRLQFISKQNQCISCDAILFYKKKKERKKNWTRLHHEKISFNFLIWDLASLRTWISLKRLFKKTAVHYKPAWCDVSTLSLFPCVEFPSGVW